MNPPVTIDGESGFTSEIILNWEAPEKIGESSLDAY